MKVMGVDVWLVVRVVTQGMPCLIFALDTSDLVAVVQKKLFNTIRL